MSAELEPLRGYEKAFAKEWHAIAILKIPLTCILLYSMTSKWNHVHDTPTLRPHFIQIPLVVRESATWQRLSG